jgi:DNA repair exonuclease SbcCD ATPase subunit
MKFVNPLMALLLSAVCYGCGDKPAPRPEVKVEDAGEALKNDQRDIQKRFEEQKAAADTNSQLESARTERQKYVDALTAVSQQLSTAVSDAGRTSRSDFPALIKRLDPIKAEANAVAVDDCTSGVRASLLEAHSTTSDAFNLFAKEKGPASKESSEKLAKAMEQLDEIGQALGRCRAL